MIFIGVDPDLHCTAVATIFLKGPFMGLATLTSKRHLKGRYAVAAMAQELHENFSGYLTQALDEYARVGGLMDLAQAPVMAFVEGQEIYPGGHQRPNNMIQLANLAGMIAGQLQARELATAMVLPKEWSTVPKKIRHLRLLKRMGWEPREVADGYYPGSPPSGYASYKPGDWKHLLDAIAIASWARDIYIEKMTLLEGATPPGEPE